MPPLRDRIEDIQALAEKFIDKFSTKYHKKILPLSEDALSKLKTYSWPGNIRELSHVIERAVLMSTIDKITSLQLLLDDKESPKGQIQLQPLEQAERQLIEEALAFTSGNINQAARILEISRSALYRRIEKHYPNILKNENIK